MGLESYRRQVSESKHKAILEAAEDIFLAEGFNKAAMVDIAKKADVSTATLYKHFASKEELFNAVVERTLDWFGAEIVREAEDLPADEALRLIARNYLKMQYEGRVNALLRAVIAETPNNPDLAANFYKQGVLKRNADFIGLLQRLARKGKLRIDDPTIAARQMLGLVKEDLVWPAMFHQNQKMPANTDKIIDEAIKTFLARYGA